MAPPDKHKAAPSDVVFDVASEEAFATQVLAQSHQRPVVVDFWAAWCGPCRQLGPTLERLAQESGGAWCLAKVDIEPLQNLAIEYQITSIPAVKVFSQGEVIDEFVGALPEPRLRMWLEQWAPGPADDAMAQGLAHEQGGALDEAKAAYELALTHKPLHPPAVVGLARVALAQGDRDAAQTHLGSIAQVDDDALEQEIARMRLQLSQEGEGGDLPSLQAQAQAAPEDLDLQLKLGHAYAAAQQHEDAFQTFLSIIEKTRTGPGEKAKEAMVQLFAVVGMHSELATRFRSALSQLLFS